MRLLYLFMLIAFISCNAPKTTVEKQKELVFKTITNLSSELTETSGLEYYQNQIITHNDSGDSPTLYFLDTLGNIKQARTYSNMKAVDWEDITRDDTNLFIADTGNNYGDRKDLIIYKIKLEDINNENAPVKQLKISYPNQTSFMRGEQNHPYDAESLVAIEDNLYIFSKDWKDQTTIIYKFNKQDPIQKAQYITSYDIKGLVTGATFDGLNTVTICGYNSNLTPFIYEVNYRNGTFDFKTKEEILIEGGAQVEGIISTNTNSNKESYYLSSEAVNIKLGEDESLTKAQLYKLKRTKI